jgi:chromosome segregation ATPase
MENQILQQILTELKEVKGEINEIKSAQQETNNRLDTIESDIVTIKNDIKSVKRDAKITRVTTNTLVSWVDEIARVENVQINHIADYSSDPDEFDEDI